MPEARCCDAEDTCFGTCQCCECKLDDCGTHEICLVKRPCDNEEPV